MPARIVVIDDDGVMLPGIAPIVIMVVVPAPGGGNGAGIPRPMLAPNPVVPENPRLSRSLLSHSSRYHYPSSPLYLIPLIVAFLRLPRYSSLVTHRLFATALRTPVVVERALVEKCWHVDRDPWLIYVR